MLSGLLVIPLLGAIALLLWPGEVSGERFRRTCLALLVLQVAWSLWVLWQFDPTISGLQLEEIAPWVGSLGLDYRLGIDGLSLPLVLINGALSLAAALVTSTSTPRPRLYYALLLLISGAVNGAFLAQNLLLFFLFYELELIPLWLLIAIWGGSNRAYAATKFLLFTAVSGVLILGAFFGLALATGTAMDDPSLGATALALAVGTAIGLALCRW